MTNGRPDDIHHGGCSAWPIPLDDTCARVARSVVRATLTALRLPGGMVDDATVMASELVTNIYAHARGDRWRAEMPCEGLPELWLYVRRCPRPEIVVKAFDSAPWRGAPEPARPALDAENGRGFEIVDALTQEHGGTWGLHRSRSRLGAVPVPGKVAYFSVPIPYDRVPQAQIDGRQAAHDLHTQLAARGLGPLYRSDGWNMAVISVSAGLDIWVRDGTYVLTTPEGTARYPLEDIIEVCEETTRIREHGSAHSG